MNSCKRLLILLAAVTALSLGVGTSHAWAWWSSTATATATVKATTIAPPTLSCGTLGVLSVTFNWTAVAGATSYTLTAGGTTYPNLTTTSKTIVTAINAGTATVVANQSFGSTTWTSLASNSRSFTVAVVSVCA